MKKLSEEDILFFLSSVTFTQDFNTMKIKNITKDEKEFDLEFYLDDHVKKKINLKDE